jgi:hypothetical protein
MDPHVPLWLIVGFVVLGWLPIVVAAAGAIRVKVESWRIRR